MFQSLWPHGILCRLRSSSTMQVKMTPSKGALLMRFRCSIRDPEMLVTNMRPSYKCPLFKRKCTQLESYGALSMCPIPSITRSSLTHVGCMKTFAHKDLAQRVKQPYTAPSNKWNMYTNKYDIWPLSLIGQILRRRRVYIDCKGTVDIYSSYHICWVLCQIITPIGAE